jgi:thioredoxin 1
MTAVVPEEMSVMSNGMRIGIVVIVVLVAGGILVLKSRDVANQSSARSSGDRAAAPEAVAGSQPATTVPDRLPRLIDLGATKCIPCKMMAPILEQLKKEYAGRLVVEFLDVWENRSAGDRYGIRTIPTQIFFDATGKELFRHEGFYSKEDILGKWKELGVDLEKKPVPS